MLSVRKPLSCRFKGLDKQKGAGYMISRIEVLAKVSRLVAVACCRRNSFFWLLSRLNAGEGSGVGKQQSPALFYSQFDWTWWLTVFLFVDTDRTFAILVVPDRFEWRKLVTGATCSIVSISANWLQRARWLVAANLEAPTKSIICLFNNV